MAGNNLESAHQRPRSQMKIHSLTNDPLSPWLGFNALIFCICSITIMLLIRTIDKMILPRIYGAHTMSALKERERKSFVFHHVAGPIKSIVFFSGIYPAWQVVLSDANFNTPVVLGSTVCMGDMLMVAVQLFCSLYLAELLFRVESIGMLSVAHHIATILTANVAYGLSGYTQRYPEACVEIYLCIVWGFFDLIATAPLDPVLIARRLVRNTHPINIHYSLYATAAWSLIMTLLEIAATSYFLYGGWDRLSLAVWLVTPLCFGIWAVSQVHSAHVLRILAKGQEKMIEKRRDQEDIDVERIEGTGGISSASSGRLSVEKAL